jgi:hypothetical protein
MLHTVTLGNSQEEIGEDAFGQCTSLEKIIIPPAVKVIDDTTFKFCQSLTTMEFCDEIEEFMSCKGTQYWWPQGVQKNH